MSRKDWSVTPMTSDELIIELQKLPKGTKMIVCDGYEDTITPLKSVSLESIPTFPDEQCAMLVGINPWTKS